MNLSIVIPTFNNFLYLKFCIESLLKNSKYSHEIIVHINGEDSLTKNYLIDKKISYTKSAINIGLCSGVNLASKKTTNEYILYSHDDMYYLPNWDVYLTNEIKKINTNHFYFSLTNISFMPAHKGDLQHIHFDCGKDLETFDEILLP